MEGKILVDDLTITRKLLEFETASPQAKQWWKQLESLNHDRPGLVARLAEELLERSASIDDFYIACSYSGYRSVQANLGFLDLIYQDRRYPTVVARPHSVRRVKSISRTLKH